MRKKGLGRRQETVEDVEGRWGVELSDGARERRRWGVLLSDGARERRRWRTVKAYRLSPFAVAEEGDAESLRDSRVKKYFYFRCPSGRVRRRASALALEPKKLPPAIPMGSDGEGR